jgi:hypothetical protein
MFLDIVMRTQSIALRALSGSTRRPPHQTNKKGELAIETREPIDLTRDCAKRDDIRELNTALGITTKVAEPKDKHGGEEGVRRARCVDDLVTLRHPPIGRLISTIYAEACDDRSRRQRVALRFIFGVGATSAKSVMQGRSSSALHRSNRLQSLLMIATQHATP